MQNRDALDEIILFSYYNEIYNDNSEAWKNTLNNILEMKKILDRDNVSFLIMIIPDFHNLSGTSPYQPIYNKIEKAFLEKQFSIINMFPVFQKNYSDRQKDLWIQADDPHPNENGHALMAEELYKYLKKIKTENR